VRNAKSLGLVFGLVLAGAAAVVAAGSRALWRDTGEPQSPETAAVARNRQLIKAALRENPGREREWLDSSIRARSNDRAFLLAALTNDSISPEILDILAKSRDLSVALEAIRNPNTETATLENVYRRNFRPAFLIEALAAHRRTPPYIFRELYQPERDSASLDIWFAGNPSTPREILAQIARKSTSPFVIAALLENPKLDCWLQGQLARNLMKEQNRDADNPNVQRLAELIPDCIPGPALDSERSVSLR
jgi:hypothetical protein